MHLKKIFVLLLLISFNFSAFADSFKSDDILGFWLSEKKTAVVEISKIKNKFMGKIVWLKDIHDGKIKNKFDDKNPKKELQKRSLMGLEMLYGFVFTSGEWKDGKIYDPESGKTYSAKMKLESAKKLDLRGYVGIPMFGRSSSWEKQKTAVPDNYSQP